MLRNFPGINNKNYIKYIKDKIKPLKLSHCTGKEVEFNHKHKNSRSSYESYLKGYSKETNKYNIADVIGKSDQHLPWLKIDSESNLSGWPKDLSTFDTAKLPNAISHKQVPEIFSMNLISKLVVPRGSNWDNTYQYNLLNEMDAERSTRQKRRRKVTKTQIKQLQTIEKKAKNSSLERWTIPNFVKENSKRFKSTRLNEVSLKDKLKRMYALNKLESESPLRSDG